MERIVANVSEHAHSSRGHWGDDLFGRAAYASFLTEYLTNKVRGPGGSFDRSFTISLDAGWGRGKTYFVERWAKDLREATPPHPVLEFNAWQADFAADPLLAFMGSLRAALDSEIKQVGLQKVLKERAQHELRKAFAGARRAVLPAAAVLLKGIAKQYAGVVWEDFEGQGEGAGEATADKLKDKSAAEAGRALDAFFVKAMEEQTERAAVIAAFKGSVRSVLKTLTEGGKRSLPLFVFVDELDRCRPSFAISLLEGMKHVFGVDGVCFVVSTNLEQLAHATRAVYGEGFDGANYLKRFFDVGYALPEVSPDKFTALLVNDGTFQRAFTSGMPRGAEREHEPESLLDVGGALAWVAEAFELDFRSQRQVFEVAAAAAAMAPAEPVALLWLFILAAFRHKSPAAFERLASSHESLSRQAFDQVWTSVATRDAKSTRHSCIRVGW